jgi:23S rRNA (uracil1939-C5)-methyltransferase
MTAFKVLRLGRQGDGIVETPDGQIHVPKALPRETIEMAEGSAVRIVEASADRVSPFCQHYDICGGCKFQHWRAEPYAAWKRDLVVEALGRVGLNPKVGALVDAHGEGRRRATLHVRRVDGRWRAGFMVRQSHELVAIEHCPVLAPALQGVSELASACGLVLGDCDVAITLARNGLDVSIKAERKAAAQRMPSLMEIFNTWKLARLAVNGEAVVIREKPRIALGIANVNVPVGSFLQATQTGEACLVSLVLAGLPKAKHVADLFSGLGTFTFPLAERFAVSAFDSDRAAISALQEGARNTQGLKPVAAATRNLFNAPLTPQELKDFDSAVLDPPRAGAEAQAKAIAKSELKRVVYVSCDPSTFARDARLLADSGFELSAVTPVDQFKWTAHVELVGVFTR